VIDRALAQADDVEGGAGPGGGVEQRLRAQ
jgi:hypothetical protein